MAKVKAKFKFERSTKGAHRYQEIGDDGEIRSQQDAGCVIGTLYVRKTGGIGDSPFLNVEITPSDE